MIADPLFLGCLDFEPYQVPLVVCVKKQRPILPSSCPEEFQQIIQKCWAHKHKQRPTASELVQLLEPLLERIPPSEQ